MRALLAMPRFSMPDLKKGAPRHGYTYDFPLGIAYISAAQKLVDGDFAVPDAKMDAMLDALAAEGQGHPSSSLLMASWSRAPAGVDSPPPTLSLRRSGPWKLGLARRRRSGPK